jgi:hypothetical protein
MNKPRRRLSLNDIRERHEAARYWRRWRTASVDFLCALEHRNRRRVGLFQGEQR